MNLKTRKILRDACKVAHELHALQQEMLETRRFTIYAPLVEKHTKLLGEKCDEIQKLIKQEKEKRSFKND